MLGILLILPMTTFAQSASDIQAQINAILRQVAALQKMVTEQNSGGGSGQPTQTTPVQVPTQTQPINYGQLVSSCRELRNTLRAGSKGEDVAYLHMLLQKEGFSIDQDEVSGREYGESTASSVTGLQEKYRNEILTPVGLKYGSGLVGTSTRKKLNALYNCTKPIVIVPPTPCPLVDVNGVAQHVCRDNAPVISGVSGPQSLNVNQQGTWTVTASSRNGGNLSYSVLWGDEELGPQNVPMTSSPLRIEKQNATFTHAYYYAGNFTPTFTVTSENTIRCITTPCPTNGGSAQTSLSVNVGNVASNSVTVLSPNGGETWAKGTTQTIKWQDKIDYATCPAGSTNCYVSSAAPRYYDIFLNGTPSCSGDVCTTGYSVRTIAKEVSGSSYQWTIPNCTANNPCSSNFEIGAGPYTIKICRTDSKNCDSSDSYFKIVSGAVTNAEPRMGPVAVPVNIGVGQSVNFNFSATDADNDDLSWSVDWGDGGSAGSCQINPPSGTGQNWSHSTSHAWNTAGSYLVKVNVSDCRGGTAETSFTVKVGGTTSQAPIIYSLSQISGPVGTKVVIYGKGFATGPQAITNRPVPVNGDNSINFGSSLIPGITSLDGTSITFIIPSYTTPACLYSAPACKIAQQQIMPGIYPVSVTNTSGTSNAVDFTVTGGGTTQPSITVAYPNGGENIIQGQQIAISWKSNSVSGVFAYLVPETSSYGAGSLGIIGYVSSIYSYMGWDGATVWDSLVNGREIKVPPGKYKIYLVGNVAEKSGQTVSDMSDTSFTVGIDTTYHPADTNKDSRITVSELTAYGNGQYAASASNIWRNGEAYRRDSAQQDWVPTST